MARKSDQIASLFASVGFKIDKKSIRDLDASLKRVEGQLSRISKAFGSLKGNNSITKSLQNTKRDAAKAATEINTLSDSFKRGIAPLQAYTLQLSATASAMRALTGAMPVRLPRVPSAGGQGGGTGVGRNPRTGAATGFLGGLFGGGTTAFARGLVPGIGLAYGVKDIVGTGRQWIGLESAFSAITGDRAAGKAEIEWVKKFAKENSLDYMAQAESYKNIVASATGSGMQGEGARQLFKGASLYGAALQIDPEIMKRGMTALGQMLSKGKVMSEELEFRLAA